MARNRLLAAARVALMAAAAGLLAATLVAFTSTSQLGRSNDELRHTLAVLLAVDDVMALIRDAEGGARGYIISGQDTFLAPYRTASPAICGGPCGGCCRSRCEARSCRWPANGQGRT